MWARDEYARGSRGESTGATGSVTQPRRTRREALLQKCEDGLFVKRCELGLITKHGRVPHHVEAHHPQRHEHSDAVQDGELFGGGRCGGRHLRRLAQRRVCVGDSRCRRLCILGHLPLSKGKGGPAGAGWLRKGEKSGRVRGDAQRRKPAGHWTEMREERRGRPNVSCVRCIPGSERMTGWCLRRSEQKARISTGWRRGRRNARTKPTSKPVPTNHSNARTK